MKQKRNWRVVLTWLLLIFAVAYTLPTFVNMPSWYPFQKTLHGGLDLRGGIELRYTVAWQKAIEDTGLKAADSVRTRVVEELAKVDNVNAADLPREKWTEYADRVSFESVDSNVVQIVFADEAAESHFDADMLELIDERFEVVSEGDKVYRIILPDKEVAKIRKEIVRETRDNFEKRIAAMGLIDPDVRVAGDADISAQIPGVGDEETDIVRKNLGRAAQLTLRFVDNDQPFFQQQASKLEAFKASNPERGASLELAQGVSGWYVRGNGKSDLVRFVRTLEIPKNHLIGYEQVERIGKDRSIEDKYWRTHYLHSKVELTGKQLARARASYDDKNKPVVYLDLNSEGARLFGDATGDNVGEYMAIMLDNDVASAPQIEEKISGGRARITVGGVLREARALAQVLNQGAYQAPVYKVQDNVIDASLGADSVSAGTTAMVLGFALVVAFMILYYKVSGIIAVSVLAFNLLLILMLLISFNAALTLPGIAGIILTIGMAVDANIIVFERIREEVGAGKSVRAAVDAGYAKALSAILDANITTALAGFILLNYTSGTIRNFAVTLLMGIVCSVFTAVIVARMIFNWWLTTKKPTQLSI